MYKNPEKLSVRKEIEHYFMCNYNNLLQKALILLK